MRTVDTVVPHCAIPPFLGGENQYSETAVLGRSITFKKNPIQGLKWAVVLGGRRYWEGGIGRGGVGRDCVGRDCTLLLNVAHLFLLLIP